MNLDPPVDSSKQVAPRLPAGAVRALHALLQRFWFFWYPQARCPVPRKRTPGNHGGWSLLLDTFRHSAALYLGFALVAAVAVGALLAAGRNYVDTAWWLAVFPGLAVTMTVVGLNLLGDGLRDLLDPRAPTSAPPALSGPPTP